MEPSVKPGRTINFILKESPIFALLLIFIMLTARSAGQCIPIDMAFGYTPPNECINKIPVLKLNYIPMGTIPSEDGIYPGTRYFIDWGDGTQVTWISTAAERVPPTSIRWHEYHGPSNCIYEMTSTVTSPCNPAYVKNFGTRVVIHGRDITADGDGNLLIQENGTGVTQTIRVCQGSAHLITLKDASTWNCQNPIWPDETAAPKNDSPRTIQWIYGEDNSGVVWNTIGTTVNPGSPESVMIDGSHPATTLNGYNGTPVQNITSIGQLSRSILIPASCRKNEYFDVYLLGWNKCNPYPTDAPVFTHIRILVVDAPGVPLASDKDICVGGDLILTAVQGTPAGDQLTWYANPDKTGILGTGNTYIPQVSLPGTYKYYVASGQTSGDLCSGPAREVILTIHDFPAKPGINVTGALSFCFDGGTTKVTLTANPSNPAETSSYQWYRNGNALNTAASNTFNQTSQSGTYTLRVYGVSPSSCPSPLSDPKVVSIYALATTTNPSNKTVCQGSNTSFSLITGGAAHSIRWQRKTPTGTWIDITGPNAPNDGCTYSNYTTATLSIANSANSMNGYQYRVKLTTTAGGCQTFSGAATLTVNPLANITQQPAPVTICEGDNATFTLTAGVSAPSVITSYQWQRKPASGNYVNITSSTDGGIYSDFNTSTLKINGAPYLIDKYTYQCVITTTGGCPVTSSNSSITVNRYAKITEQPPARTVCEGYNTVFTITDDNSMPVTGRQWQVSTDGGTSWSNLSNGGTYAGTGSAHLSVSNIPASFNGYRYRCILTTAGMCTVLSDEGILSVNPLPGTAITGSSVSDPVICAGQTAVITISNSVSGVSYQLQLDSDGSNVGSPVNGNGGNITFSVTPAATTTYRIRAGIISTGCDKNLTDKSLVTVNQLPVPSISGNNNVCANTAGVTYTTSDAGGRSFTWEISGGSINSGQGTNTISVTWGAAGTGWINVKEKINATGCEQITANYNVTINPGAPAEVPSVISGSGGVCRGGTVGIDVSDVATAVQYIWDYSWVAGTNNAVTTGSMNNIDLAGLAPGQYTISVAGANGCGTGTFMNPGHSFTINDIPDLSTLVTTVCSDEASGVILSIINSDPLYCTGMTYNITSVSTNGLSSSAGSPVTGTGFSENEISGDAWTNNSGSDINVIYKVVPVSSKNCAGTEEPVTVSVKSKPAGSNASIQICSGSTLNYNLQDNLNSSGNGQPSAFVWKAEDNPMITGETTTDRTTGIINDQLVNLSGTAQTIQYTVTPTGTNLCTGSSFTITVLVESAPAGTDATVTVCSGVPAGFDLQSAITNGQTLSFTWSAASNDNVTGESTTARSGNIIDDRIKNTTGEIQEVIYTVTPQGINGCTGSPFTVKLNIKPEPVGGNGLMTICSDAIPGYDLQVSSVNILGNGLTSAFRWSATDNPYVSGESVSLNEGSIINDRIINISESDQVVHYTISPAGENGCAGADFNVDVTVRPAPSGADAEITICSGSAISYDIQSSNINLHGNGLPSTFIWNASDNPDVTGETTGNRSSGIINEALRNLSGSSQTVLYTITPTGSNLCTGKSFVLSVIVDPEPVLNSVNAEICSDATTGVLLSDVHDISASFEIVSITPDEGMVPASGNAATGAGLSADAIAGDKWTNLSSGPLNVIYSVIPVSGKGCRAPQKDIAIKINPEPVLSDPGRTICSNSPADIILTDKFGLSDSFNLISVRAEAGLAAGTSNSLPGNGKASGYLSNDTWKNNSDHPLTVTYTVVPVINGICTGDPAEIILTVRPPVSAGAINGSSSVCYNSDAPVITSESPASGGDGIISYSWYQTNDLTAIPGDGKWSLIGGAEDLTYDPGIIKEPVKFLRKAKDGSCDGGAFSNIVTIMVKPLPVTPAIRGEDKLCDNAKDKIYQITNNPGSTYTWTVPNTILEKTFDAGLYFIVVDAKSGTPGSGRLQVIETDQETGCTGEPVTFDITVSPVLPGGEITGPGTVCQADAGISYSVPEVPGSVYSWIVPAGASISNDPKGHEILVTFSQPVTGMISVVETTPGGCTTVHTPKTVIVNELPSVYKLTGPEIYCEGENGVTATLSGSQAGVNYSLFRDNVQTGETKQGNGQPISWNGITAGTYVVKATSSSSSCMREMSGTVTISARSVPVINLEPSGIEVCENGGPVSFTAKATGVIDSLRWQVYDGTAWTDIHDGEIYSGAASYQLSLRYIPVSFNGYRYRISLKGKCANVFSKDAFLTVNANPVVMFGSDTINACGGSPVRLDGNPAGGSGLWQNHLWTGDTGPLNDRNIQAPLFNAKTEGTYLINYRVKDSNGCSTQKALTIIVDSPDADFAQEVLTGCAPLEVSFSKDMSGLSKFWWDFGDGSPLDSISTGPVHRYIRTNPVVTEYFAPKLTVQSAMGCRSTYTSIVTLYPVSDASFSADKMTVCSGEPVIFTAARGATKYWWDFGDGITAYSPGETNSHIYTNFTSEPSEFVVKLSTTSYYGCTGEKQITVKVLPSPKPAFSADPVSQAFDISGNKVSFKNETASGSIAHTWIFGDGGTSDLNDPVHTFKRSGTFRVILIARNEACSDSISHEIIIVPQSPVAAFDTIPAGCEPLDIRIVNTSAHIEIPGTSFLWNFGDGTQSTAKEPYHTFFNAGTYRVELTVKGPGGTSYSSRIVTVYPSPRANFDLAPNVVFVNDENVRMFNLSKGADTYLWEFGDGDTSGVKEPMHKYMKEGVYDVTLHTKSDNGCTNTYIMSPAVTVKPAGELRFSTVFTPNKEGPIERTDLPTGGPEIDQFFFPPLREEVHNYKLQIFNRWGVLVFESRDINTPWNGYYKGMLCPQGVYVWYVEGKYATGRPFRKVGDITLLH